MLYYIHLRNLTSRVRYKVVEFNNTTSLSWFTNRQEFLLQILVTREVECNLTVTGKPVFTKTKVNFYHDRANQRISYYLVELSPMMLWKDPIPKPEVYSYLLTSDNCSWMNAYQHCDDIGGKVFSLSSYEQWHIIMDNVQFLFSEPHNLFWRSSLVYLGLPLNLKVST